MIHGFRSRHIQKGKGITVHASISAGRRGHHLYEYADAGAALQRVRDDRVDDNNWGAGSVAMTVTVN
jgi:hypothetical protein